MTSEPAIALEPVRARPRRASVEPEPAVELRPGDRLLVVAPHPDDESLATGGLLQQARAIGAEIRVVFLTDGDRNPWAQLVNEGRWPVSPSDRQRWGRRRRAEVSTAMEHLGAAASDAEFLGLPDQRLTDLLLEPGRALERAIESALDRWSPTVLVTPSPSDVHPDHSAAAVATLFAIIGRGEDRRPAHVLHYCVHPARPAPSDTIGVRLDDAARELKRRAISSHVTQLWWRKRQLLSFARDTESFEHTPTPRAWSALHPIRYAFLDRGVLQLKFEPRVLGLGAANLRIASLSLGGSRRHWSLRLHALSSRAAIHDEAAGTRIGAVPIHGRGVRRVAVPLGDPAPLAACYVKLEWPAERRLGLFDRAGWRAVPVPLRAPASMRAHQANSAHSANGIAVAAAPGATAGAERS